MTDDEGTGRVRRTRRGHRCLTTIHAAGKPGCPAWVRPDDFRGALQLQHQQRRGPWEML